MLVLTDVSKGFGGRTLFANVSLPVNREDRIGLVGPNGAGKSTLFSLILDHESPDAGKIERQRNLSIGHLPQESAPVGGETVLALAMAITPEMVFLREKLLGKPDDAGFPASELAADRLRFDLLGGWELEAKAKKILRGLGFRERDFNRPAREMSGGWVMRAHLARLLVHEPDLLLLDEPTNHLDLETLLWFQDYLQTYPGAILIISHDRDFLNQLATSIVEIRQARLYRYRGNYDAFLEQREAIEEQLLAAWKNQQRDIARLQLFVDRFRAKNTKATQAQSKLKQIERMDKIAAPQSADATVDFEFPKPKRSGLKAITLVDARFAYGEQTIYDRLNFQAERGQRIVLVGPNGAGKSTLLKLCAGVIVPSAGHRQLGYHVKAGYYSQYRIETLHPQRTVLEEAFDTPQRLTETFIRSVLGCFLFCGDDVFKKVSVLSGGEKSRLALVKLLLDPPNLLLMDEPTTHLDLSSVDALLYALSQFDGTLVFISHDVYFIRSLANHVVQVENGRLVHYPGDYQYYLDKIAAQRAQEAAAQGAIPRTAREPADSPPRPGQERREQKRLAAEQRQARSRERKAREAIVHRLEKEIAALEARQAKLTAELENPATYQQSGRAVEINRALQEIVGQLPRLAADWEIAATRLTELESENLP
jgi:ATP-binding cassette subfamily F protein 3